MTSSAAAAAQLAPLNNSWAKMPMPEFVEEMTTSSASTIKNILSVYTEFFKSPSSIVACSLTGYESTLSSDLSNDDKKSIIVLYSNLVIKFLEESHSLLKLLQNMETIVSENGAGMFLAELTANPIVSVVLRKIDCKHGVGGHFTIWKTLFAQSTWSTEKMRSFFSALNSHLVSEFKSFHIPTMKMVENESQWLKMKEEIVSKPNFGEQKPSNVDMIVHSFTLEARMNYVLNLPSKRTNLI